MKNGKPNTNYYYYYYCSNNHRQQLVLLLLAVVVILQWTTAVVSSFGISSRTNTDTNTNSNSNINSNSIFIIMNPKYNYNYNKNYQQYQHQHQQHLQQQQQQQTQQTQRQSLSSSSSLLLSKSSSSSDDQQQQQDNIYGIPGGYWTSTIWNWGYSIGTGHDCAMICRTKYNTQQLRQQLIIELVQGQQEGPTNMEEIKLIFGLVIQTRQRLHNSPDGGPNGYRNLIPNFINGVYDNNNNNNNTAENGSLLLIQDLIQRYSLINPSVEHLQEMNNLLLEQVVVVSDNPNYSNSSNNNNYDCIQRQCFGYVLRTLQFIERGF